MAVRDASIGDELTRNIDRGQGVHRGAAIVARGCAKAFAGVEPG
jgi:hypothetical protein